MIILNAANIYKQKYNENLRHIYINFGFFHNDNIILFWEMNLLILLMSKFIFANTFNQRFMLKYCGKYMEFCQELKTRMLVS